MDSWAPHTAPPLRDQRSRLRLQLCDTGLSSQCQSGPWHLGLSLRREGWGLTKGCCKCSASGWAGPCFPQVSSFLRGPLQATTGQTCRTCRMLQRRGHTPALPEVSLRPCLTAESFDQPRRGRNWDRGGGVRGEVCQEPGVAQQPAATLLTAGCGSCLVTRNIFNRKEHRK